MKIKIIIFPVLIVLNMQLFAQQKAELKPLVLKADNYKHYVDYFNNMEDENIKGLIPNAQAWDWMKFNIPLFDCPQQNFEEMFYFRWWTLRKHIIKTPVGLALTEFLINRSYADKYNLIACAFGHHLNEGRWLHDQQLLDDYTKVWFRGDSGKPMKKFHGFSSWAAAAVYNRYLVNDDKKYIMGMLLDLDSDYKVWETEKKQPNGLFWQTDVKDGMEETISGGRREKNERTTINSYMFGNAIAISKIAELANNKTLENKYQLKADTLKELIQTKLWNDKQQFFETLKQADTLANVKEEVGFIPWYFNLPDANKNAAWTSVTDTKTFNAPYGITTADRSHPQFRTHGCCKCEWDGAVWPFATSQTLTSMANLMNNYKQNVVADSNYFNLLQTYVESQYHRGRPYVGEYLDEKNGFWLMGDAERSRYYNHSTFNDLIITGLIGLRPRADDVIEVNPLIPQNKWNWFCLDNVLYHNKLVTIVWDKDGTKYKLAKGFSVWVNGKKIASSDNLQKLVIK